MGIIYVAVIIYGKYLCFSYYLWELFMFQRLFMGIIYVAVIIYGNYLCCSDYLWELFMLQ
jgi:hypothetical protein